MTEVWADIARIESARNREFWTRPGKARKPVVIEDSASMWRAQGSWTLDYLRQTIGHRTAPVDRVSFVIAAPPSATQTLTDAFGDPKKFTMDSDEHQLMGLQLHRTRLEPGDTLYVPAGWWHSTFMTEISVSVPTNCVNQTNWTDYGDAMTKHDKGVKGVLKSTILRAIGVALMLGDTLNINALYRPARQSQDTE